MVKWVGIVPNPHLDYHMCRALGLPVQELNEEESDLSKEIVQTLDAYTENNIICKLVEKDYRAPFVRLYDVTK